MQSAVKSRRLPPVVDVPPPAPPPESLQMVQLEQLVESPFNPRKDFNKEQMQELTADVALRGVLQPVLARPLGPDKYELVFGHRRYRAARAAGLTQIPAIVRELSDAAALELQLVENLKREDLHPLEVAAGYRELIEKHGLTREQLAQKVGRSLRSVHDTLQLNHLGDAGRKAFLDDKLNASTALLVATVPAEFQAKCTKEFTEGRYGRAEPMTVREARDWVQENYRLDLRQAVFDPKDAELVPAVGACEACPLRAGNRPELADSHPDVCTSPKCYRDKVAAHAKREAEARGVELLQGKKADAALAHNSDKYVKASSSCYDDEKYRSYDQLLKPQQKKEIGALVLDQHGDLVEVFEKDKLKAALKEAGKLKKREGARSSSSSGSSKEAKEKAAKETAARELREKVAAVAVGKVVDHVEKKGLTKKLLWLMVVELFQSDDYVSERRGWKQRVGMRAVPKEVEKLTEAQLLALVFELAAGFRLFAVHTSYSAELKEACELAGVDLKKTEAEVKAAAAVATPAAEIKPAKKARAA